MKKLEKVLGSVLCAMAVFLAPCSTALAAPFLYTLTGHVLGHGMVDTAGYLSQLGITAGSTVSYSLIIDLDAPANITYGDGSVQPYTPTPGRIAFFASYVTGSTITSSNYLPAYNGIAARNVGGGDREGPSSFERYLGITKGNNYLTIQDILAQPDASGSWPVGLLIAPDMHNTIYAQDGTYSNFYFEGIITNVQPTPLPSALLLLAPGLAGLIAFRRKRMGRAKAI
jgi:hypothetical protein